MVTMIGWHLELHKYLVQTLYCFHDVNGLYTQNPKIYKNAKLIKEIKDIDKI